MGTNNHYRINYCFIFSKSPTHIILILLLIPFSSKAFTVCCALYLSLFINRHFPSGRCCLYSLFFSYRNFKIYPVIMCLCMLIFILCPVHQIASFPVFCIISLSYTRHKKNIFVFVSYRQNFVCFVVSHRISEYETPPESTVLSGGVVLFRYLLKLSLC